MTYVFSLHYFIDCLCWSFIISLILFFSSPLRRMVHMLLLRPNPSEWISSFYRSIPNTYIYHFTHSCLLYSHTSNFTFLYLLHYLILLDLKKLCCIRFPNYIMSLRSLYNRPDVYRTRILFEIFSFVHFQTYEI